MHWQLLHYGRSNEQLYSSVALVHLVNISLERSGVTNLLPSVIATVNLALFAVIDDPIASVGQAVANKLQLSTNDCILFSLDVSSAHICRS